MTPEEAREQVRLRLKAMADHPGSSVLELTAAIYDLFHLLAPDGDLGQALTPKVLAEGWARYNQSPGEWEFHDYLHPSAHGEDSGYYAVLIVEAE